MSSFDQSGLYERWRALSEAEGQAIRGEAWTQLAALHAAKAELQEAIAEAEQRQGPVPVDSEDRKRCLTELIALERSNLEALTRARNAAEAEQVAAQRSRNNLRRLQQQLGGSPVAGWQRYS